MFYDRNIKGLWVSGDGVVYADFDRKKHTINQEQLSKIKMVRYVAGVDWGYEHFGSIVVIGIDAGGRYYVVEEHAHQRTDIDDWVKIAKKVKEKYGNIPFYCDSARPEYVFKFRQEKLNAINANKKVILGIETVATLMKSSMFFIDYDNSPRFRQEIYNYIWHKTLDEPKQEYDDVQDSIRYAILSDKTLGQRTPTKDKYKAIQSFGL